MQFITQAGLTYTRDDFDKERLQGKLNNKIQQDGCFLRNTYFRRCDKKVIFAGFSKFCRKTGYNRIVKDTG